MTGEQLKTIIEKSGYTQRELAGRLGMPPQSWTRILKSKDVKSGLLEQLAAIFGVGVGELYGETDTLIYDNRLLEAIRTRDSQIDRLIALVEQQTLQSASADCERSKQQD